MDAEDVLELSAADDQQSVEALAADTSDPTLYVSEVQRRATSLRCQQSSVSGLTRNAFQARRGSIRLSAARSSRSCGSNRGCRTWRRRIDN
jgi:hypothetical protein